MARCSMSRGPAKGLRCSTGWYMMSEHPPAVLSGTNSRVNLYVASVGAQVHVLAQSSNGARQIERDRL